jgi:hypothetical protein
LGTASGRAADVQSGHFDELLYCQAQAERGGAGEGMYGGELSASGLKSAD